MDGITDRIRALRKEKNFTQIELANAVGIAVNSLRGYEAGKRGVPLEVISKLAEALNVTPEEIIFGKREIDRFQTNKSRLVKVRRVKKCQNTTLKRS